jgi:hypothetical protein
MIWRSLICFNFAVCAAWSATLSGTVILRDSHVDAVNRKKDYSGVVIYAQPVGGTPTPPPPGHATMLQKGKTFTPHVLPVMAGTTVDFPNADPIFHNAFSSYNGQIFDVGLYAPGTSRSVRFTRLGVLRVFCNIHPAMSAIILVLDTQYFAKTTMNGSWELKVPAGEYDLSVFHERATEQELSSLGHRVIVTEPELHLPPIMVSEAGYLVGPHKNKYGHDYPPSRDDQVFYPGVRN